MVLTATSRTQGWRANDYDWCIAGELVWVGPTCARDRRDPDGGAVRPRPAGMTSHRATTTAVVSDLAITRDEYVQALADSLDVQGWNPLAAPEVADQLVAAAARWPVGEVIERRLDVLSPRSAAASRA